MAILAGTGAAPAQASPAYQHTTPELLGVSAVSGSDVWAVGDHRIGRHLHALAEHFDRTVWSVIRVPEPLGTTTSLSAVSAVSPHDVWAVGSLTKGFRTYGLVVHRDGSTWTSVTLPDPPVPSSLTYFTSVSAPSADNIWIGCWLLPKGHPRHGSDPVAAHWNGSTWTWTSPGPANANASIDAVTTTSPTSTWAVGSTLPTHRPGRVLVEHWSGHVWTRSAAPSPPDDPEFLGVSVVGSGNVWAVGWYGSGQHIDGLLEHWDGTKWTRIALPHPPAQKRRIDSLTAVDAVSPDDVRAVGYPNVGTLTDLRTIALHWDGTRWSIVTMPRLVGGEAWLDGVSMSSGQAGWAIGAGAAGTGHPQPGTLAEHWDGHSWHRVATPDPGSSEDE